MDRNTRCLYVTGLLNEHKGKRAYRTTNQLIHPVLTDPVFKGTFFKTAAKLVSRPGHDGKEHS